MKTERDFEAAVATAPEKIRQMVYMMAWQNAWAADVYYEYKTDADRWAAAIRTAEMIIDWPEGYGL